MTLVIQGLLRTWFFFSFKLIYYLNVEILHVRFMVKILQYILMQTIKVYRNNKGWWTEISTSEKGFRSGLVIRSNKVTAVVASSCHVHMTSRAPCDMSHRCRVTSFLSTHEMCCFLLRKRGGLYLRRGLPRGQASPRAAMCVGRGHTASALAQPVSHAGFRAVAGRTVWARRGERWCQKLTL